MKPIIVGVLIGLFTHWAKDKERDAKFFMVVALLMLVVFFWLIS